MHFGIEKMEKSVRTFDSEIIIDSSSRWFFRGNEITLDTVLAYFRENLYEDEGGIYIFNSYGNLSEKGYVTCIGYPLKIVDLESQENSLSFIGDNKSKLSMKETDIFVDPDNRLLVRKKDEKRLLYVCSRDVHTRLGDYIEDENGNFFLKYGNYSLPIQEFPVRER